MCNPNPNPNNSSNPSNTDPTTTSSSARPSTLYKFVEGKFLPIYTDNYEVCVRQQVGMDDFIDIAVG